MSFRRGSESRSDFAGFRQSVGRFFSRGTGLLGRHGSRVVERSPANAGCAMTARQRKYEPNHLGVV